MDKDVIFHRHDLADRLADMLLGDDPLRDSGRSGLFMAAARRTGKSTFLRNDLIPTLQKKGALPIYVDLWEDRTRDPGELISSAVGQALETQLRKVTKALASIKKLAGKVDVAGFKAEFGFERDTIGQRDGTTLAKAFTALHARAKKPIVLILDEAQHALMTESGTDMLFALKAARDALNLTAQKPQLAVLATGSVRGKLANMVLRRNQPFYGANVMAFPTLDQAFVQHLAAMRLGHRFGDRLPSGKVMLQAFSSVGFRPEEMSRVMQQAVTHPAKDLGKAMLAVAEQRRAEMVDEWRAQFQELPPLQQSVLKRMYSLTTDYFEPFPRDALEAYSADVGKKVTASQVQKALDTLVAEGFVWRSGRGSYELDEAMLSEFLYDEEMSIALEGFENLDEEGKPGA